MSSTLRAPLTGEAAPRRGIHPFVILFGVLAVAVLSTWLLSPGEYDRTEMDGREVVVEGTYQEVAAEPAGVLDLFSAVHRGMVEAAEIIFFVFVVGGAFGVLSRTRAVENGITGLAMRMQRSRLLLIPVVMTAFALAAATFGMFEEGLPFVLLLTPVALKLGFDSITGAAMVLVGLSCGFTAAITNPFTIGVAQSIAQVPLFSGMGPRIGMFVVYLVVGIAYVYWYALRVRRDPSRSLTREQDAARREEVDGETVHEPLDVRQKVVLGVLLLTMAVLIWGVTQLGWFMTEISALFLAMALIMGLVTRMGIRGSFEAFADGCRDLVVGALCIGFAYATVVVLTDAAVIDTILYGITSAVSGLSSAGAALGMLGVQGLLNFIITSGSGQAALSMPLMSPLADLVGVSQQTAVLAFQFGDGITNIFAPTSGLLLAALAMARIGYGTWFRFIWPLILIQFAVGAVFLTVAHLWIWPA
ncbi:YfcC family protein [Georgenia alba]|uniref:YfcC family protein n=1 Tax=Georgenia alba TaxID=2233858 RepID=A0ABW2Q3T7_9MICO